MGAGPPGPLSPPRHVDAAHWRGARRGAGERRGPARGDEAVAAAPGAALRSAVARSPALGSEEEEAEAEAGDAGLLRRRECFRSAVGEAPQVGCPLSRPPPAPA